jgi:hypothetical protein
VNLCNREARRIAANIAKLADLLKSPRTEPVHDASDVIQVLSEKTREGATP